MSLQHTVTDPTNRLAVYLDRDVIELTQEGHQILHPCVVVLSHCQLQDSVFHVIMCHVPSLQQKPASATFLWC